MPRDGLTRRAVLGGLAGCGLAACSSSPTFEFFSGLAEGFKGLGRKPGYSMSDAQIEAIPYASLGIQVKGGSPGILILATIEGEDLHWVTADRAVFVTRHGRLVKTVGLPQDLARTSWVMPDPVTNYRQGTVSAFNGKAYRLVDLKPDDFDVPVESSFERLDDVALTILGRTHETTLLRERIKVRKWRWKADNLFWIDKNTGRIWRSTQQFCPAVPPITFEILKPAPEPAVSA